MKSLICYWQTKLDNEKWLMSAETRAMIKETIRCLREMEKQRKQTQVEREAEIVRTVKQLDGQKVGKADEK